jgi:hypothetical protein
MKLSDRLRAQYAASAHGWHYPDMLEAANELDRLAALAVPPVPTVGWQGHHCDTCVTSMWCDYHRVCLSESAPPSPPQEQA